MFDISCSIGAVAQMSVSSEGFGVTSILELESA